MSHNNPLYTRKNPDDPCHLGITYCLTMTLFSVLSNLIGAGVYHLNAKSMAASAGVGTPLLGCILGCITSQLADSQPYWGKPCIAVRDIILWIGSSGICMLGSLLGSLMLETDHHLQAIDIKDRLIASAVGNSIFFGALIFVWTGAHIKAYQSNKNDPMQQPLSV